MAEQNGAVDVGRLLRVKGVVDAVVQQQNADAKAHPDATAATYSRLKAQVREAIPPQLEAEFDGLFPEAAWSSGNAAVAGMMANRNLIAGLAGYLDGLVKSAQVDAQMAANADAYARERVKAERGVGFQPSELAYHTASPIPY